MTPPILGIWASQISGHLWAPAGAYDALATVTVPSGGAASVTFAGIPTGYKHLQIRTAMLTTTGGGSPAIRFNSDTGSNYFNHFIYGTGSSAAAGSNTPSANLYYGGANNGTSTTAPYVAVIDILDYANTNKNKTVRVLSGFDSNGAAGQEVGLYSGAWASTAAISSIDLYINKTYTTDTVFALYGVK